MEWHYFLKNAISLILRYKTIQILQQQSHINLSADPMQPNNYLHLREVSHLGSSGHPSLLLRLIFFIPSAVFLIFMVWQYMQKYVDNNLLYFIYTTPHSVISNVFDGVGLLLNLAIGVYAVFADCWSTQSWIIYVCVNVAVGVYHWFYAWTDKPGLCLTVLTILAYVICLELLFIHSKEIPQKTPKLLVRNIIGYNLAAGIFLSGHHLGQMIVYVLDFSKKCQMIFFWVSMPIIVILVGVWNKQHHGPIDMLIGYLIMAVLHIIGFAIMTNKSYF